MLLSRHKSTEAEYGPFKSPFMPRFAAREISSMAVRRKKKKGIIHKLINYPANFAIHPVLPSHLNPCSAICIRSLFLMHGAEHKKKKKVAEEILKKESKKNMPLKTPVHCRKCFLTRKEAAMFARYAATSRFFLETKELFAQRV